MQIDIDLLFSWGAITKEYKKNEILFHEDDPANFYYQIIEGSVKMYNTCDEGKEFIQGYFSDGQCFGEPPLFINGVYPASAVVFQNSKIIKLSKDKFLKILDEYPSIQKVFLQLMAKRIHSKSIKTRDIVYQKPEHRITTFLNTFKDNNCNIKELIPYTRQEIANFTGLRVETVIRTLTKMSKTNKVDIINHKIYF